MSKRALKAVHVIDSVLALEISTSTLSVDVSINNSFRKNFALYSDENINSSKSTSAHASDAGALKISVP